MKSNTLNSAVRVLSLLLFVSATCALAQDRRPVHFSGLINDYSPLSANVKGSPWEMHGQWSMDLRSDRGTADFSADMTMSGFGKTPEGAVDPTQPLVNPHTHHIRLTNIKISWDMIGCPTYLTPAPNNGCSGSGAAKKPSTKTSTSADGNAVPFIGQTASASIDIWLPSSYSQVNPSQRHRSSAISHKLSKEV